MVKTVSRKTVLRRWWLAVHLYLGLSIGLLLAMLGLTGSLLVFYIELDEWLNPELVIEQPADAYLPFEHLLQSLQRAHPERIGAWRLEIPVQPQRMITARFYKPAETAHQHFAPLMVSINPYTGSVVKSRFWGQTVMTWIYDLHYTLLLDQLGKILVAVLGGVLLVSAISGLYLWWPASGKWRTALSFKTNASVERRIYDIHKLSGSYSAVLVLMLALTGVVLEIPEYVNPLIAQLSPLHTAPKPLSDLPQTGISRISVDQALNAARQLYPDARLVWIETPANAQGSYRFNLRQDGEPGRRFPKTNVWVDQYSGRVLAVDDPHSLQAGDTLLNWMHPLHSGEAFDLTGRVLVCLSGIACVALYVTGVWRWLQKRRAKRGKIRFYFEIDNSV